MHYDICHLCDEVVECEDHRFRIRYGTKSGAGGVGKEPFADASRLIDEWSHVQSIGYASPVMPDDLSKDEA